MPMPKGHEVRPVEERFWSKVERTDDCWIWTGGRHDFGYGIFWVKGKFWRAHRWSYQQRYGPIPDGLDVLHRCDNPPCVNPDHLFVGTAADNCLDMRRKGRSKGAPAILSLADRRTVRELREQGVPGNQVARMFSISPQTVCNIYKGRVRS
jgi:hypothetical protein